MPQQRARERSGLLRLLKNPFFWAAVIGVVGVTAVRPFLRRVPSPPPVLGQIPPFSLVDHRGEPFGSEQLAGSVYLVGFFSADCAPSCEVTRAMRVLQQRYARLRVDIRLVSIGLRRKRSPATPLRAHARAHDADLAGWTFLRGTNPEVRGVIDAARQGTAAETSGEAHPQTILLVDQHGGIRGRYGTDRDGVDELFHRSVAVRYPQR